MKYEYINYIYKQIVLLSIKTLQNFCNLYNSLYEIIFIFWIKKNNPTTICTYWMSQ